MVLHCTEVQRKVLQDEVVAIIEDSSKGEVTGLGRHVEVYSMNKNEASEEEWVRSARIFKKRSIKNKIPDIRNMLTARVS